MKNQYDSCRASECKRDGDERSAMHPLLRSGLSLLFHRAGVLALVGEVECDFVCAGFHFDVSAVERKVVECAYSVLFSVRQVVANNSF